MCKFIYVYIMLSISIIVIQYTRGYCYEIIHHRDKIMHMSIVSVI